eukprot:c7835_g1_i1.p1 GENE.c7835_g1_i1~~c7835_g1_i1.p1  ORF type:complete len:315 (+),score=110.21 c7835_g1_i1:63-1007(+)
MKFILLVWFTLCLILTPTFSEVNHSADLESISESIKQLNDIASKEGPVSYVSKMFLSVLDILPVKFQYQNGTQIPTNLSTPKNLTPQIGLEQTNSVNSDDPVKYLTNMSTYEGPIGYISKLFLAIIDTIPKSIIDSALPSPSPQPNKFDTIQPQFGIQSETAVKESVLESLSKFMKKIETNNAAIDGAIKGLGIIISIFVIALILSSVNFLWVSIQLGVEFIHWTITSRGKNDMSKSVEKLSALVFFLPYIALQIIATSILVMILFIVGFTDKMFAGTPIPALQSDILESMKTIASKSEVFLRAADAIAGYDTQ